MPGAGGPSASLTEFLAAIQTAMYGLIADLTSRVGVLEEKAAIPPAPSQSGSTTTYMCNEPVAHNANLLQTEILNGSPSIGSLTIPGGTLQAGSSVTININGSSSTGSGSETLTFTLFGSPEPPILICSTFLPVFYAGAIDVTFILMMRETDAIVRATIVNGTTISSASSTIPFNRSVDCTFGLIAAWSDTEGGGALTVQSRTIEIKPQPTVG